MKVIQKPINTIGSLFPKPKEQPTQEETQGAIYWFLCKDCEKTYSGESKRKFETRTKEHEKAVVHLDRKKFALAEHYAKLDTISPGTITSYFACVTNGNKEK